MTVSSDVQKKRSSMQIIYLSVQFSYILKYKVYCNALLCPEFFQIILTECGA